MSDAPKPGSRGKFFGVSVLILVVVGLVWMGFVTMLATRRGGDAQTQTDQLKSKVMSLPTVRPVLRGTAVPGKAWEEYDLALAAIKPEKDRLEFNTTLTTYMARQKGADRGAVEALVKKYEEALRHLRQGVQREEGQYAYDWEKGYDMPMPSAMMSAKLALLGTAQARLLEEAGRPGEAAALLLDLAQFAHDLAFNGPMISLMIGLHQYFAAFDELREVLQQGKLSKGEAAAADAELAVLDRSFQSSRVAFMGERLGMGYCLRDPDASLSSGKPGFKDHVFDSLGAWRYGFSFRLEMAEALIELDELMTQASERCERPWSEVKSLSVEISEKIQASHNRVVRYAAAGLLSSEMGVRQRHACLRLLRVAAHYQATGEILELGDPYGKWLKHAKSEGKLRAWSVGSDGQDNGGVGDWRTNEPGKDIVLEIGG